MPVIFNHSQDVERYAVILKPLYLQTVYLQYWTQKRKLYKGSQHNLIYKYFFVTILCYIRVHYSKDSTVMLHALRLQ